MVSEIAFTTRDLGIAADNSNADHSLSDLGQIPANSQRLYPDLVVKAISETTEGEWLFPGSVAPELWANLEICKAWFAMKKNFHRAPVPETMKDNEEFGLFVAKHQNDVDSFSDVTSEALRSNRSFMMKALAIDASLFLAAVGDLRHDFEFAVTASAVRIRGAMLPVRAI